MAAMLSGLANVGASVGKFLSNPAVQKGLSVARDVTAPFMQQPQMTMQPGPNGPSPAPSAGLNAIRPMSPAQATGQPVAQGGQLGNLFRGMYAKKFATPLGQTSPDIAGSGLGTGAPARGSL